MTKKRIIVGLLAVTFPLWAIPFIFYSISVWVYEDYIL